MLSKITKTVNVKTRNTINVEILRLFFYSYYCTI